MHVQTNGRRLYHDCFACFTPCPLQLRADPKVQALPEMDGLFRWRRIEAGDEIYGQDDLPEAAFVVSGGWVSLQRIVGDGRRHIIEFAVPGDLIGFSFSAGRKADHFAVALTDVVLCVADHEALKRHLEAHHPLVEQVGAYLLAEQNLARQQLTNITQNPAINRTANLLLQLFVRVCGRSPVAGDSLAMPLTQEQIGDAIGLTAVHVNRMLRQMRIDGVLTLKSGTLCVLDAAKFQELARFDVASVLDNGLREGLSRKQN